MVGAGVGGMAAVVDVRVTVAGGGLAAVPGRWLVVVRGVGSVAATLYLACVGGCLFAVRGAGTGDCISGRSAGCVPRPRVGVGGGAGRTAGAGRVVVAGGGARLGLRDLVWRIVVVGSLLVALLKTAVLSSQPRV